jgi:PhoPQ-activated pathogenicity-related protein
MHHHYRSLGGWTFAFKDYYDQNITMHLDSSEIFQLEKLVGPESQLSKIKSYFLSMLIE